MADDPRFRRWKMPDPLPLGPPETIAETGARVGAYLSQTVPGAAEHQFVRALIAGGRARERIAAEILASAMVPTYFRGPPPAPLTRWERMKRRLADYRQRVRYAVRALRGDWPDTDY